jgi:hypothetical protein
MDFRHSLEMSLSREEFLRLLPAAVPVFDVDGDTVRWSEGGRPWRIRLVPLAPLRMAGARLPRHRVDIALPECAAGEGVAFMARFDRAFLRAGG